MKNDEQADEWNGNIPGLTGSCLIGKRLLELLMYVGSIIMIIVFLVIWFVKLLVPFLYKW